MPITYFELGRSLRMRILLHSDELGDNACYALQSGMKHMLLQMSYYADFYTTPAKGVARVGFREFPFVTYHPFFKTTGNGNQYRALPRTASNEMGRVD